MQMQEVDCLLLCYLFYNTITDGIASDVFFKFMCIFISVNGENEKIAYSIKVVFRIFQ